MNFGSARATIICRDTEVFEHTPSSGTFASHEFNPAPDKLVRLSAEAAKYHRFRIRSMVISWVGTSSASTDGVVKLGIAVGPSIGSVNGSKITSLRPGFVGPVWKTQSIKVGTEVMLQNHLISGKSGDADSVAFTLYVDSPKDKGVIKVSYVVEFSFPVP